MPYVYQKTECQLYTVGFYDPSGKWIPESDHSSPAEAANRVAFLNGHTAARAAMDEALNSGDGTYRP